MSIKPTISHTSLMSNRRLLTSIQNQDVLRKQFKSSEFPYSPQENNRPRQSKYAQFLKKNESMMYHPDTQIHKF
jgi:hypothetical protein